MLLVDGEEEAVELWVYDVEVIGFVAGLSPFWGGEGTDDVAGFCEGEGEGVFKVVTAFVELFGGEVVF